MASKEHTVGFGNLLAFWYMAEIYASNRNDASHKSINCMRAASYYKYVAENGHWNRLFTHAWREWKNGNVQQAMAMFSFLAELGREISITKNIFKSNTTPMYFLHIQFANLYVFA